MKLAIVVPKINLETGGGSHWSLYLICRGLRELNVEVEVYPLNPTPLGSAKEIRALGVPLIDLDSREDAKVTETLGGVKADAVLVYGPLPIAYELKRQFSKQRVLAYFNTLSGFCTNVMEQRAGCWLRCSHWDRVRHHRGRIVEKIAYLARGLHQVHSLQDGFRSLDGCIFDSVPLCEVYRAVYCLPEQRCWVVPECIDFNTIAGITSTRGATEACLNVVYIGSLADYKGIRLLFEALRRLRLKWRVWVFGDGPERPQVLAFHEEFPGRVVYRGHVDNRSLFRELAERPFLFVHPCLWFEAFGRSIVEAMALGIPVIVPDIGGPAWIVKHGANGLQYKHRDPEDLARVIEWVAKNPQTMSDLAAAGRERASEFDYRLVASLWYKTLQKIVASEVRNA